MTRPPTAARVDPDRARRYLENNAVDSRHRDRPWRGWREVGHTVDGAGFMAPVCVPASRGAGVRSAALRDALRAWLAGPGADNPTAAYLTRRVHGLTMGASAPEQMTAAAALREAGAQVAALREDLRARLTCGWTPPTEPRENR